MDSRQVGRTDAAQKDRAYRMLMNRKFSEKRQLADAGTTRQRLRQNSEQLISRPHTQQHSGCSKGRQTVERITHDVGGPDSVAHKRRPERMGSV